MRIQYFLNADGDYITPCPNGMKVFIGPCMVGSRLCLFCKYFGREDMKTVNCLYEKPKHEGQLLNARSLFG